MSRSGYCDDIDEWAMIRWRGAVKSAVKGKRGQAFLKEMLAALDALPQKKLISGALVAPNGEVCALGSVMVKRGIASSENWVEEDEEEDWEWLADNLGIAEALAREIMFINDERGCDSDRFDVVRKWVVNHIADNKQLQEAAI